MKTKGITIWEKHAEKFVLGLAFVAAGAVTAMQFIGEPNAVSTPAGDVGPGEIDALLQSRAEALLAKLRDDAPAGVDLPYPKLGFDDLLAQRNLSLSPVSELPPFQLALAPSVVGVGLGKNLDLTVPSMKAPDQVAVGQYVDALARYNFMTILDARVETVNLFDAIKSGYFYGSRPVSLIKLDLETVWFRAWTTEFMPPELKAALGVPETPKSKG